MGRLAAKFSDKLLLASIVTELRSAVFKVLSGVVFLRS